MNLDRVIAVRNRRTVFRDGSRCIKVFGAGYAESDVLSEALNMARAAECGIAAPRLLDVSTAEGRLAMTYEYIPGRTLAQLMEERLQDKSEHMERFVDIQLHVQAHTCPLLNHLKDELWRSICQSGLSVVQRRALHARLKDMPNRSDVCHGDFNPTNVIIDPNDAAHVIDWAQVTQGDAAGDAAATYMLFLLQGDLSGAEMYLNLYCQQSGADKARIIRWVPIVAASRIGRSHADERDCLMRMIELINDE